MKRLILVAALTCLSTCLFAQLEEEISAKNNQFSVKSIINQVNTGYTRSINHYIGISFEAGYQFRYLKDRTDKNSIIPLELLYRNLVYSGVSARFSTDFRAGQFWTISPLTCNQPSLPDA